MKNNLSTILIVLSAVMLAVGIAVDVLAWFGVLASEEPPVVVHLSTWALIFAGSGNLLTAIVNKKVEGK